jgi:hypothetical protein
MASRRGPLSLVQAASGSPLGSPNLVAEIDDKLVLLRRLKFRPIVSK